MLKLQLQGKGYGSWSFRTTIPIYLMNSKARHISFIISAILAFAAMLYHTVGAVQPFDSTAAWRHMIFIGVCTICIYGLLKRPRWFVWFFGILMIQQLYSHGGHLILLLRENRFNPLDTVIVFVVPLIFILLLTDKKTTV
jgi:hypothetical protein